MQHTSYRELEQEITKMTCAIRSRNTNIGRDLIADLTARFTLEEVAGAMLISLEQVIWLDGAAFVWAVEQLIPADMMQEIRRIMSVSVSKQLIGKGMIPGTDFSVDATGRLLLNSKAQAIFLKRS